MWNILLQANEMSQTERQASIKGAFKATVAGLRAGRANQQTPASLAALVRTCWPALSTSSRSESARSGWLSSAPRPERRQAA